MTGYHMPTGRYCQSGDYVVRPNGEHGWDMVRLAIVVATLTSAGWAWLLQDERATSSRLLAEAQATQQRVERLTIHYVNGVKATVEIKEQSR